jgi:hypothetical protein
VNGPQLFRLSRRRGRPQFVNPLLERLITVRLGLTLCFKGMLASKQNLIALAYKPAKPDLS